MRLIGTGNYPGDLATSGAKSGRETDDVGQYPPAVAAFLDEKRDHTDHDQSRSTWIDRFLRMASPSPLLLPVVLTLLNQPVVELWAWAGTIKCDCAALIRIHPGESSCDATMITGHSISVNGLRHDVPKATKVVLRTSYSAFAVANHVGPKSNKRPE